MIPQESKKDFRLSWQYYKSNWKTLVGFSLFIFLSYILLVMILAIFFTLIFFIILEDPELLLENEQYISTISILAAMPGFVYMTAFTGSLFGFAYDIMSSGDEFTEFKNAFMYFKELWWPYIFLSLLSDLPMIFLFIISDFNIPQNGWGVLIIIGFYFFSLIWYSFLIMTMPAVTAQRSIKQSLIDNYHILKKDFRRVFTTLWLYFLPFSIPSVIFSSYFYVFSAPDGSPENSFGMSIAIILTLVIGLVGNPLLSMVCTRIYNTHFGNIAEDKSQIGITREF